MSADPQLFRIDPESHESEAITEVEFAQLGFQERRDIQEWVAANPGILGEKLLIIGKEFSDFDRTNERLDLLAVDEDGRLVVIELKRDDTGADAHWQAIKYASYLHRVDTEGIIGMLADYAKVSSEEAGNRLLQHLNADDLNALNNDQRIILASHRFAPEVTSAALWLNEKAPGKNLMTCVQLTPYQDAKTGSLYVQANTIIPVPGAEDYMVGVGETLPEEGGQRQSNFAANLRKAYDKNRGDEVTRFLKEVGEMAISGLPDQVKPDKTSRWAGGWAGGALDHRYYRLWYSRAPWSNWEMSHRLNLFRGDNSVAWKVDVEFAYFSGSLASRIGVLHIHDEQQVDEDRILVTHESNALDPPFAQTLSVTLRRFIETITPVVDEFEDESNEEDV